ncbi:hypothetical protein UE46_07095 [Listeria weihenstephanensis]|uniref:Gram-positive cocci surface proteins LPxTG domain-containing protein n=1 Tax=Listeria weihenstephanensis TaxID=1006155 RepID=A0A1S7FTY5_9LIST|nr:SpaA isopeptide-forming pilin-related protein [Listeria weihenstephanensis]AQY50829.1 hypothetical protein UE46_07095 [Listeria weihenstephanensis]
MKKFVYVLAIILMVSGVFMGMITKADTAKPQTKATSVGASTGKFTLSMKVHDNPIVSSGKVTMDFTLDASADAIVDSNGLIEVSIPKEIYSTGNLTDLNSDSFTYDHTDKTTDPDRILVYVKPDASFNVGQAWSASFSISFQAVLMRANTTVAADQIFKASYAGQDVSQTLQIQPQQNGTPTLFEKWWHSSVDSDGICLLNPVESQYNTFQLALNIYKDVEINNVTIVDEMPDGLEVDPNPALTTGVDATDKISVDGIRIIKYDANGDRTYVTSQYASDIKFDAKTQKLTVHFDHIAKDEMLLIEYKVSVAHVYDTYVNTATMTSDEYTKTSSDTLRIDGNANFNKVLKKTVDKNIITTNDKNLQYSLTLNAITGTIKAGQTFSDTLDSRLSYKNAVDDADGTFDIQEKNNVLTITVNKDIPIGEGRTVVFNVDPTGLAIGDTVPNTSSISLHGENYDSNIVNTKKISGEVVLNKVDKADPTKVLEGAKFKLLDSTGKTLYTGATNTAGKLALHGMAPGSYQLVETQAPDGYQLDATPIPFSVAANTYQTIALTAANEKLIRGTLVIHKVDAETGSKLAGASFELVSKDDPSNIKKGTTDEDGNLTFGSLIPGKYTLTETIAPTGYLLSNVTKDVEISATESKEIQLTITNKASTGGVVLTKRDKDTNEVLQGATFTLQSSDGLVIKTGLTTDELGQITVTNLLPGEYQFIETSAPDGYVLDSDPISFQIMFGDEANVQVEKLNQKKAKIIIVPPTPPVDPVDPPVIPPVNPPADAGNTPKSPTNGNEPKTSINVPIAPTKNDVPKEVAPTKVVSQQTLPHTGDSTSENIVLVASGLLLCLYAFRKKR